MTGGLADARIETVGGVERAVVFDQRGHLLLHRRGICALFQHVVLMQYMAEEVAVIEFRDDLILDLVGKRLESVDVVAPQGNVEGQDLARILAHDAVPDGGTGCREAVQHGFGCFGFVAGEPAIVSDCAVE